MNMLYRALLGLLIFIGGCSSAKLQSSRIDDRWMVRHYFLGDLDSGKGVAHGRLDSIDVYILGSAAEMRSTLLGVAPDICLDGVGVTGRLFGYPKGVIEFSCNDYSAGVIASGGGFISVALPDSLKRDIVRRVNRKIPPGVDSLFFP